MSRAAGTRRRLAERRAIFVIPGDLDAPTGGYAYDRRIIGELRRFGWDIRHVMLNGQFPAPDAAILAATYRTLALLPEGIPIIVDGLALGALPDIGCHLGPMRPLVAMVHHPLALEFRHHGGTCRSPSCKRARGPHRHLSCDCEQPRHSRGANGANTACRRRASLSLRRAPIRRLSWHAIVPACHAC